MGCKCVILAEVQKGSSLHEALNNGWGVSKARFARSSQQWPNRLLAWAWSKILVIVKTLLDGGLENLLAMDEVPPENNPTIT